MTDFSTLLQPDRGQPAHDIHVVHPDRFADWAAARRADPEMLTEWQVYRMFDSRRGAWATFQFLVRGRLVDEGTDVRSDGALVS